MKYMKISQLCEQFYKIAQAKGSSKQPIINPKQKNEIFWSNFLMNAIKSYALKFTSPKQAKAIFDNIAIYNQSPAYHSNQEARDVDAIDAALKEAAKKLTTAGLDPVTVLKRKGMINVNPNILNILHKNLEIIRAAKDFSGYQHYYLQAPGEPKEVIDLDTPGDNSAGY